MTSELREFALAISDELFPLRSSEDIGKVVEENADDFASVDEIVSYKSQSSKTAEGAQKVTIEGLDFSIVITNQKFVYTSEFDGYVPKDSYHLAIHFKDLESFKDKIKLNADARKHGRFDFSNHIDHYIATGQYTGTRIGYIGIVSGFISRLFSNAPNQYKPNGQGYVAESRISSIGITANFITGLFDGNYSRKEVEKIAEVKRKAAVIRKSEDERIADEVKKARNYENKN